MNTGTRGSKLALIQAEIALRKLGVSGEIKVIKTEGDESKKNLKKLGGRAFTRELDDALLSGEVDLTVHSLKDIPVEGFPMELEIVCVVERADSRDCLVSNKGVLEELPEGAVVGASSERRRFEMLNLRGDLKVKTLRGNIPTRREKLDRGDYDAIVTAKCALDRLGLSDRITQVFGVREIVPAAGQGAIAVVKRKNFDLNVPDAVKPNLLPCVLERFFISGLGACRNPVGAYCEVRNKGYWLVGLTYAGDSRATPEFSGSFAEVKESIERWKDKYF